MVLPDSIDAEAELAEQELEQVAGGAYNKCGASCGASCGVSL